MNILSYNVRKEYVYTSLNFVITSHLHNLFYRKHLSVSFLELYMSSNHLYFLIKGDERRSKYEIHIVLDENHFERRLDEPFTGQGFS